jgi:uncharacterized protein
MAAVCLLAIVCTAQELPKPSGAINDFANVLSEQTEALLKALIENVEHSTTAEIAVATVSSLDGTTVDDYAVRLFQAWGIGQKGRDNGVLVVVAPSDRQIRIEVGYGLEGVLPDGLAGVVIRESFLPPFRDGDFDKGVLQGVTRVAEIIRRNETLTAEQLQELTKPPFDYTPYVFVPFLGLFVVIGMGVLGAGLRDKDSFFRLFGSAFGGIPLLLSSIFGLYALEILALVGLVAIAVGYFLGAALVGRLERSGRVSTSKRGSGSSSSSWSSGSSGGSSSSGSSSSSSGGFGGGRSGGGGASGSW